MLYKYDKIKEKYNNKLKKFNQNHYIIFLNSEKIVFSNGITFYDKSRKQWINRLNRCNILLQHFDDIITGNVTIQDVKKICNSRNGKLAWELKGEELKEKLKGHIPWNIGLKGKLNPLYGRTISNETKLKISEKNKGKNNGMYGRKMSDENKKLQSQRIKNKILEGNFTPNTNNRNTHWESTLDGIKYRSSWEALYKFYNPNSIYEKLRISYTYQEEEKIYIVDFIDEVQKLAIEIKPKNILKNKISKLKINSLNEWCIKNNYNLVIADEDWIVNNINNETIEYQRFDENTQSKIKKFYEINKKN